MRLPNVRLYLHSPEGQVQLLAKQVVTVMVCSRAHHVLVKSWLVYNHEVAKFMDHLKAPVDFSRFKNEK